MLPGAQGEMGHLVSMSAQPFRKLWEEKEGQRTGGVPLPGTSQGRCIPFPASLPSWVGVVS